MNIIEFKIKHNFWTDSGEWKCVDIGTRTILAYRIAEEKPGEPWDQQDAIIFYDYDFGGCYETEEEIK